MQIQISLTYFEHLQIKVCELFSRYEELQLNKYMSNAEMFN